MREAGYPVQCVRPQGAIYLSLKLDMIGKTIGHFAITAELGKGGMGAVYLADDLKLDRSVAIKVLHPEFGASVEAARFLREIRIAAGLAHPHIVPVHDAGEAEGFPGRGRGAAPGGLRFLVSHRVLPFPGSRVG